MSKQFDPFESMQHDGATEQNVFAALQYLREQWEHMAGLQTTWQAHSAQDALAQVNQRLHELRTMESWMQVNLAMARQSLQRLETQQATLQALQHFGSDVGRGASTANNEGATAQPGEASGQAVWDLMQQQFEAFTQAAKGSMSYAQQFADAMAKTVPPASGDSSFTSGDVDAPSTKKKE